MAQGDFSLPVQECCIAKQPDEINHAPPEDSMARATTASSRDMREQQLPEQSSVVKIPPGDPNISPMPGDGTPKSEAVELKWPLPPSEIHDGRLYKRVG